MCGGVITTPTITFQLRNLGGATQNERGRALDAVRLVNTTPSILWGVRRSRGANAASATDASVSAHARCMDDKNQSQLTSPQSMFMATLLSAVLGSHHHNGRIVTWSESDRKDTKVAEN